MQQESSDRQPATQADPSSSHWVLLYCSALFSWYCRIVYANYAAKRLTEWVPTLRWSEMHHFRDDFEVELCAR